MINQICGEPLFLFIRLGCLVKQSLAKTLLREKMPSEKKEYTQGYKLFVLITLETLTKIELEVRYGPKICTS